MANRFTEQRVMPQFVAEPLQEKLALPLMEMEKQEKTFDALSDMVFNVRATDQDMANGVKEDLKKFRDAREEATSALLEGNTALGAGKLRQLRKEWNKYTSDPDSRGARAQQYYDNYNTWQKEYRERAKDHSGEDVSRGMQNSISRWREKGQLGAIQIGEDGKSTGQFSSFVEQAEYAPKYQDVEGTIRKSFQGLGYTERQAVAGALQNGGIKLEEIGGQKVFRISGKINQKSNQYQVLQRQAAVMNEWINGAKANSAAFQGYSLENVQDIISESANSALIDSRRQDPDRFMNAPSGSGGGTADIQNRYRPSTYFSNVEKGVGYKKLRKPSDMSGRASLASPDGRFADNYIQSKQQIAEDAGNTSYVNKLAKEFGYKNTDEFVEDYNFANERKGSIARTFVALANKPSEYFNIEIGNRAQNLTFQVPGESSPVTYEDLQKIMLGKDKSEELNPEEVAEFDTQWQARNYGGIAPGVGGHVFGIGNKSVIALDGDVQTHTRVTNAFSRASQPEEGNIGKPITTSSNHGDVTITSHLVKGRDGKGEWRYDVDAPTAWYKDVATFIQTAGGYSTMEALSMVKDPQWIHRYEMNNFLGAGTNRDVTQEQRKKAEINPIY